MLEFFKRNGGRDSVDTTHPVDRIFLHKTCSDSTHSYTVDRINEFFTENYNPEQLLERMVIMMSYLQHWYHSGNYSEARYEYAAKEYPGLYLALVAGLSEDVLNIMAQIDVRDFSSGLDINMARDFVEKLRTDRKELKPSTVTNEAAGSILANGVRTP